MADLHRKIGAGLAHKGERKQAIEHHQKGINLLKDGPPSLELVRLYEEAAWLYMQTGDNMLAIYASEKALRLAERLGETRAASRAHGIFGRVFGRIGDTDKARENLERAVELARGSDDGETILALLALGHHLEISEADYSGAEAAYREALALRGEVGDVPAEVELHAGAGPARRLPRRLGAACERSSDASAELAEREGLVGKLCLPYALRGAAAAGATASGTRPSACTAAPTSWPSRSGWSEVAFTALFGLSAVTLRDRGDARRRGDGARPGAGRVRARRADRASRSRPCRLAARSRWPWRGKDRSRARGGRGGGRRSPSACTTRSARPPRPEADGATAGDGSSGCAAARDALARARTARWTPRAASSRPGARCTVRLPRRRSSAPPPSTSHSAFRIVRRPRARRLRASG